MSKQYIEPHTRKDDGITSQQYALLAEPQTSGGLLAAVDSAQADEALKELHDAGDTSAVVIGEVVALQSSSDGRNVYLDIIP